VKAFVIVSAITLPLCLPALQFGQANAHLGAALLLAAWCLRAQRWTAAVVLLWLATCIKPLGLAAMGLAWAAYPRLWWRLALGLPVFLGLPFLFAPPAYAWSQYLGAWENLRQCSEVTEHRFADLNGLLRTFGTALTGKASFVVRALAGGALMCVCWRASRSGTEPRRALTWFGCAASFLMLFNPMSEENSYVILAPALGLMAWWALNSGAKQTAWLLAAMVLTMGVLPELLRPLFGNRFALAWHPAMAIAFLAILAWQAFKPAASEMISASSAGGQP
jgi:alpha-1,2-mannosyltransferase